MATTLSLLRFAPLPPRLTRSSLTINLSPSCLSTNRKVRIRPCVLPISTSYTVPTIDRIISIVSYTIPFLNSLPYGRVLQSHHPLFTSPFFSMLLAYELNWPLNSLLFLAIYFGLALNPNINHYVRFNAMQAANLYTMLSILLFVRWLIGKSRIGLRFREFCHGAIFVLGLGNFVYCVLCCSVGHTPYLPFFSSVANFLLSVFSL